MRHADRTTRMVAMGKRQQVSFENLGAGGAEGSFQATLVDCERGEASEGPGHVACRAASRKMEQAVWQQVILSALSRAWALLQAKYKTSTTKRLRVSETISLGEKRFVAIVSVEGREFLIGGGISGMSLLAQLGSADAGVRDLGQTLRDAGSVV